MAPTAEELLAMPDSEFTVATTVTPNQAASLGVIMDALPDEQFTAATAPNPKPENQFNPLAPMNDTIDMVGKKYNLGTYNKQKNILLSGAVWLGTDPTSAQSGLSQDEDLQAKQTEQEYQAYVNKYGSANPITWIPLAAESLPAMQESIGGSAIGAGLGGAVGFIAGRGAGAKIGAEWGARAGAAVASGRLMSGELYEQLITAGADHENARVYAMVGGAVNGVVEAMGLEVLAGAGRSAAKTVLKSESGKAMVAEFMKDYLKESTWETATEVFQEGVNVITQSVEAFIDQNENMVLTPVQIKDRIWEAAVNGAKASLVLVGGSKAAGAGVGATGRAAGQGVQAVAKATEGSNTPVIKNTVATAKQAKVTALQAFQSVLEGFNTPQSPTAEDIKQTKEISMAEALDTVTKPGVDANGKVLQAQIEENVQAAPQPKAAVPEGPAAVPDPFIDDAIAGAPSVEVAGRIREVGGKLKTASKVIGQLETEFDARVNENARKSELKIQVDDLKNRKRALMAQISEMDRAEQVKDKKGKSIANIGKTLDKLRNQYQAVVGQLKTAEAEYGTLTTKPVDALMNQLETKQAEYSDLAGQLELLKMGAYEAEDLKGLDVKVKADKILALRAKAVKEAVKRFRQGVREGASATRQQIRYVQTALTSVIRDSDIELKDKGKFLAAIRSVQTPEQLDRIMPRVQQRLDAMVEKNDLRDAKENLKRVLKQAGLSKSKRPEGKYTADIQTVLDTYRKVVSLAQSAARIPALNARVEKLVAEGSPDLEAAELKLQEAKGALKTLEEIQNDPPTNDQQVLAQMVAEHVGDVENKTAAQVQALVDEIKAFIETGKSKRLEKLMKAKEEADALRQNALQSINGGKPVDTANMANSRLRLQKWGENWLLKIDRAAGRFISTWADIMDMLSQDDKTHALVGLMDVHESVVAEQDNYRKSFDKFIDTLTAAVESKKGEKPKQTRRRVLNRMVEGGHKPREWGTYTNADGTEVPLVVSRNEAATIYAQSMDPELQAGWSEGNKYTRPEDVQPGQVSTLELLEEKLDDLDKQMIQGVVQFFNDYHERVNEAWEDEAGASLPKNEFYSGQARRVVDNDVEAVTALDEYNSQASIKPGSTYLRTKNARPLAVMDLYTNAVRQVKETEHWLSWRKTARNLKNVFGNSAVRNTIKLKYGDGMLRTTQVHIDNMLGTMIKPNEEAMNWLRHIQRNAGTAYVGGKALSAAKQFSSVILFLDHVSVPGYVKGVASFIGQPWDLARKIKIMESSPLLKSRNFTMDITLMDQLQQQGTNQFKDGKFSFRDMLMLPVKFGDKVTIWTGGWAVYEETLAKTGSQQEAMTAFERAFNATQSSGTVDQQTQLEVTGRFGKVISLFTKNAVQMAVMERRAARHFTTNPSVSEAYRFARTIAITRFSQFLFAAASSIPALAAGDEDDIEDELYKLFRATALGAWSGIPLLGEGLDAAATVLTNMTREEGKERIWTPEFLPFEAATDAIHLFQKTLRGIAAPDDMEAEDWTEIFVDGLSLWALLGPQNMGGGLAVDPIVKMLKPLLFEPEEDD